METQYRHPKWIKIRCERTNEERFRSFLLSGVNNHLLSGPHETNGGRGAETAVIMRIIHGPKMKEKKREKERRCH